MSTAHLRLHGDLADFTRAVTATAHFTGQPALKDVIESVGVPHPEVDLVLLEGVPVTLGATVPDGARLEVFPAGAGPAGQPRLLPPRQAVSRFVLDGHLGRLASLLRMLGFDTHWERNPPDEVLAAQSAREDRVLLTRDHGLLKRSAVVRGAFVRSTHHLTQLKEVVERFHLGPEARPFTRCLGCNGLLREVARAEAAPLVPPRVRERHDRFSRCEDCGQIYWAGTHHDRMKGVVATVLGEARINSSSTP